MSNPSDPGTEAGRSWRRLLHRILGTALAGSLITLFAPCFTLIWDGGFPSIEYRLRFVDPDGNPVPDVRLEVFTQGGGPCHLYPVDDFYPGHPVVSDADGRMVFRHTGRGLEFGGRARVNSLGMEYSDDGVPRYDCVFFRGEREVHRVRFDQLEPRDWTHLPAVERVPATRPAWAVNEIERLTRAGEADRSAYFDRNRDGRLDREERIAKYHFTSRSEYEGGDRSHSYGVVERTIVLPNP